VGRIRSTTDFSLFSEATFVVEAVTENLAIKTEVFKALDRITPHPIAALEGPMVSTTFWDQPWSASVIRCTQSVNPPEAHQRRIAEKLKASYHELDTGHYPMLSAPDDLTKLLLA